VIQVSNFLTVAGFILSCLSGDIGVLLVWSLLWFPIAGSIKMEYQITGFAKHHERMNTQNVNVEGATVRVTNNASPTDNLSLGMSMGEG